MSAYRDSSGKTLEQYPRPSVAVDTAVLSLDPDLGLVVLEVRRPSGRKWALPGTFLHPGETLADAVDRSLREKAGVRGLHPRQLHVFDALDRDPRGWVLSVAHVDVVQLDRLASRLPTTRLVPVHSPGDMPWDHPDIIARAVADVRSRYEDQPDPDYLLGDEFTVRELRLVHEAIAGEPLLQRDTFRRAMEDHLVPTGRITTGTRGRPAELFRRR